MPPLVAAWAGVGLRVVVAAATANPAVRTAAAAAAMTGRFEDNIATSRRGM